MARRRGGRNSSWQTLSALVGVAVLVAAFAVIVYPDLKLPELTMTAGQSVESSAPPAGGDAEELERLRVEPRTKSSTYRRAAYGDGWVDVDRNGCSTRADILYASVDRSRPHRKITRRGCDHVMIAGTWQDPYTGKTLTFTNMLEQGQAQAIQIDHIVPLYEADVSGSAGWSRERKINFANDPANLMAVDGPTNQSKQAKDPAAWRPRAAFQCDYARRYIAVKVTYDLAVDPSEKAALGDMLTRC